jgi:hypothetical protein
MATKGERELARKFGISVRELRTLEDALRAMPMEVFLDRLFGPDQAVYDPHENLWIVRDPKHRGPGFGFIAVRPDNSFFTGVVPAAELQ